MRFGVQCGGGAAEAVSAAPVEGPVGSARVGRTAGGERVRGAASVGRAIGRAEGGFTLIELLVVVILIGVLAAIAIPVYLGVQSQAREKAVMADLTTVKTAVLTQLTEHPDDPLPKVGELPGLTLDDSNYESASTLPAFKGGSPPAAGAESFCIEATAATGTVFSVSNDSGARSGSC